MNIRHEISSKVFSLDDDPATQSFSDLSIVLEAIDYASKYQVIPDFEFANTFPGEHYRLLGGLVEACKPNILLDIGTYRGCSARIMLDTGKTDSVVHTFDLYDYKSFNWTVLDETDFLSGRLHQHLDNLVDREVFYKHRELLQKADFIMLDGPKDDFFEKTFLDLFSTLELSNKSRWLFIDDIRFDNMLYLWRAIKSPKLDLSSFGHFSGSGLVNISKGLIF